MSFYAWCCVKKNCHHIGSINISVYKKNSELVVCVFWYNRAGEPLACVPKIAHRRFPWHATFTAVPIFYCFFCPTRISTFWRNVYTYTFLTG